MEFDEEDAVDKIVLLGLHVIKGVRMAAKKGLNKEQIQGGGGRDRNRDRDFRGQAPYFGAGSSSGGYSGYGGQGQGGYSSLGQTWSRGQGGAAKGGGGPLRRHQWDTRGANPYDPYARH